MKNGNRTKSSNKIKGLLAGSFDPPTIGHLCVIELCAKISKKLFVAVGVNTGKSNASFSMEERVQMLREMTQHLPNVMVVSFTNLYQTDFARSVGANVIFRGVRNGADFDYEKQLADFNRKRAPEIDTWFLPTPPHLAGVSSSFVKQLVGARGWEDVVREYLPPAVYDRFVERFRELTARK